MNVPAPAVPTASPGLRLAAWLFDTALASVPAAAIAAVLTMPARLRLMELEPESLEHSMLLLTYLTELMWVTLQQLGLFVTFLVVIYGVGSVVAESGFHQATWGKRLVGLRVETVEGRDLTWQQALARFAAGTLSWGTLNIGHAMGRFRDDRRMLHDLASNTRVTQEPMDRRGRGVAWCLGGWLAVSLLLSAATPVDPVVARLIEATQTQGPQLLAH